MDPDIDTSCEEDHRIENGEDDIADAIAVQVGLAPIMAAWIDSNHVEKSVREWRIEML